MKTCFLIISIIAVNSLVKAQKQPGNDSRKNELKLNTLYVIGGYPELSYERALGDKFALGVSMGLLIGSARPNYATDILTSDFSLLPYSRYYFGNRKTSGFFLEGNVNIFSNETDMDKSKEWGMGLGIGLGSKFILKKNWIVEWVVGGGYNLNQDSCYGTDLCFPDVYPRLGITFGKRF